MTETGTLLEPILIPLPRDDPFTPNNRLPLAVYRSAITLSGNDPAHLVERRFLENGWGNLWRNGIYDFEHFHATTHEALGIARGSVRVRFGGRDGEVLEIQAGDVAILPAGTGHCRLSSSPDLLVVGGYPQGQDFDLVRAMRPVTQDILQRIAAVPLPETDPLLGPNTGIVSAWSGR